MNRSATLLRWLSACAGMLALSLALPNIADACGGTPAQPTCNRTIWLGKSVPKTVAVKQDGSAQLEMVLLPFVAWTNTCPAPNAASLSITLRCIAVSDGSSISLGPVPVPIGVPINPGRQRLSNGTNTISFPVPAGTLNPNERYVCTIVGSYSVTFPQPAGRIPLPAPTIVGTGDATMCLIPASRAPGAENFPELSVTHIDPNNAEFLSCRRGDQAMMHFLVENNRTDQSVTFNLESVGRQTAGLPVGIVPGQPAYDSAVSAISNPKGGTDVFPAAFADELKIGQILESGDPEEVNPQQIDRQITLGPCEARVVSIAVRSHGMCADGSCNERDVMLSGRWANGDTALACASAMLLVQTLRAKTPLCEINDQIKTADFVDAEFGPAQYLGPNGPIDHATTLFAGNLPPNQQRRGTVIVGDSLQNNPPFRNRASDYIRLPDSVVGVQYRLAARPQWWDFVERENQVTIANFPGKPGLTSGPAVQVPLIWPNGNENSYQVFYNANDDSIVVAIQNDPIYQGTLAGLISNPPRGWIIDTLTCRSFQKVENPLLETWVWTNPASIAALIRDIPGVQQGAALEVFEASTVGGTPWDWNATVTGTGVKLPESSGSEILPMIFDPSATSPFPATNLSWVNVSIPVAGAPVLNAPLPVPVVLREKAFPEWVKDLRVAQVDYVSPETQPDSRNGFFSIQYDPQPEPRYMNVIARPTEGRNRTPVWIVQNLLLPPFADPDQMIDYWFDLNPLGVEDGEDFQQMEMDVFFDIVPTLEQPEPFQWVPIEVGARDHWIGDGGLFINPPLIPLELVPGVTFKGRDTTTWVYRGCQIPNEDLDSSSAAGRPDTNYAGDWNACGPVATANSMEWLGNETAALKLPSTLREKLRELSDLMGRGPAGVNSRMLIEGKLAFIDKHKLPIRVKFQGYGLGTDDIDSPDTTYGHKARNDNRTGPTGQRAQWSYLVQEMEDDEDVEVKYGCWDTLGNRLYGHWITVSGVSVVRGKRGLYYKDDLEQGKKGGTSQRFASWDTGSSGRPMLTGMSNRNRRYYVEAIVSESYDTTVTFPDPPTEKTENLGIKRFDFAQPFEAPQSILGQVTWETERSTTTEFLNVYARLSPQDDPVWLVQNMILPPFPEPELIAFWVNFEQLGIQAGVPLDSIWMLPEVGDEVVLTLDAVNLPDLWEHHEVDEDIYVVPNGHLNSEPEPQPITPFVGPVEVEFASVSAPDSVYRGCTVPNIDLDSSRNRPTADYAGDWNACGPASAANSLHWLEQTHDKLDSTTTLREKLRELSRMMGRSARGGVIDSTFIAGKLAFIDKYKLPIHVKFQTRWRDTNDIPSPDTTGSNGTAGQGGYGHKATNNNSANGAEPTWEFLMKEMKAGEDVELVVQWTDSLGRGAGAHAVVVTGVSNATGAKRLWYKDDRHQHRAGGMQQPQVTWDTANGRPIIRELGMHDTLAYVTVLYSESYDSTVTFDTIAGTSSVGWGVTGDASLELTVLRNPSNVREPVEISFVLDRPAETTLMIYDLSGRVITTLREEQFEAGQHRLEWDGRNGEGEALPAGLYFLVLRQGEREGVVRMVRY